MLYAFLCFLCIIIILKNCLFRKRDTVHNSTVEFLRQCINHNSHNADGRSDTDHAHYCNNQKRKNIKLHFHSPLFTYSNKPMAPGLHRLQIAYKTSEFIFCHPVPGCILEVQWYTAFQAHRRFPLQCEDWII